MAYAMRSLSDNEIDEVAGAGFGEAVQAIKDFFGKEDDIIVPGTDENGNIIGSKEAEEAKDELAGNNLPTNDNAGDTGNGGSGSGGAK